MKNLVIYNNVLDGDYVLVKQMNKIGDFSDFKKGLKVFSDPPYNELLTDKDCLDEYNSYMDNGLVFACYVNSNIAGINYNITFPDNKKVAYYAGLAVLEKYINRGFGKILVDYTEDYLESINKYDYTFARILCEGSMSEPIFKMNGFSDFCVGDKLIVDEVTYDRNDPSISKSDKRKYMVKKLNPNALEVRTRHE